MSATSLPSPDRAASVEYWAMELALLAAWLWKADMALMMFAGPAA